MFLYFIIFLWTGKDVVESLVGRSIEKQKFISPILLLRVETTSQLWDNLFTTAVHWTITFIQGWFNPSVFWWLPVKIFLGKQSISDRDLLCFVWPTADPSLSNFHCNNNYNLLLTLTDTACSQVCGCLQFRLQFDQIVDPAVISGFIAVVRGDKN